jgi:hypothetical protein
MANLSMALPPGNQNGNQGMARFSAAPTKNTAEMLENKALGDKRKTREKQGLAL